MFKVKTNSGEEEVAVYLLYLFPSCCSIRGFREDPRHFYFHFGATCAAYAYALDERTFIISSGANCIFDADLKAHQSSLFRGVASSSRKLGVIVPRRFLDDDATPLLQVFPTLVAVDDA